MKAKRIEIGVTMYNTVVSMPYTPERWIDLLQMYNVKDEFVDKKFSGYTGKLKSNTAGTLYFVRKTF